MRTASRNHDTEIQETVDLLEVEGPLRLEHIMANTGISNSAKANAVIRELMHNGRVSRRDDFTYELADDT